VTPGLAVFQENIKVRHIITKYLSNSVKDVTFFSFAVKTYQGLRSGTTEHNMLLLFHFINHPKELP
jgi:hypothetical protein